MVNIQQIKAHQESFLAKVKKQKEPKVYIVEKQEIQVNLGVFPPATDTRLLASHINVKPGDRFLDLTTGSGSFSIIAALQGASGIAVDINDAAVVNANENFKKYKLNVKAIKSDLFQKVPEEKFDYIFANGPFFEGDITDPLDYACYGARKFLEDLLKDVSKRLTRNGKLLIVLYKWSDLDFFQKKIKENNLNGKMVATRDSEDKERTYLLYEVTTK